MAASEGTQRFSKTKLSIFEAYQKISEVADQEARQDEAELEQLRQRAAKVDHLQQENDRLRKELEVALKALEEKEPKERVIPPSDADSSEEYSPESKRVGSASKDSREKQDTEPVPKRPTHEIFRDLGTRDVAVQTLDSEAVDEGFPNKVPPTWTNEELEQKYNALQRVFKETKGQCNVLQKAHTSALGARKTLEDRVRQQKDSINGHISYSHHLYKKVKKLEAELKSCPHGHGDALSSSPPRLLSNKALRKSGSLAGQSDSDDEWLLARPRSLPSLSNSRIPSRPSSPLANSPIKLFGKLNNSDPQDIPRNEAQTNALPPPNDEDGHKDSHDKGTLSNEETSPLALDQVDQELPKLKDGSGSSISQHSNHTSSTQGEPYTMQQVAEDTNSPAIKSEGDSPVLVRTRRLHRSRPIRANTSNHTAKVEELSSSPVGLAAIDYGESMDLDDHPHMVTPRKRKTPLISHGNPASRLSVLNEMNIRPIQMPRPNAVIVERPSDKPTMNLNALQPMSSNKQLSRQIDDGQPPRKRQRGHASPAAIASLAEDDENFEGSKRETRGTRNEVFGPLSDLLEKPASRSSVITPGTSLRTSKSASRGHLTPGTSPLSSRPTSRAGSKSGNGLSNSLMTSRLSRVQDQPKIASSGDMYEVPSSSPRAKEPETASKAIKSSKKKYPERRGDRYSDHKSLRHKPLDQLTLDDFKVNPLANHGYKHAYQEVVRKKGERRCLPGCEGPCCAPQFRQLAEMTISTRIGPPSESMKESDKRALMNYLGDDFPKYSKMSADKRHETLVLAMARQLATDHGKHRHAFARLNSPPGFWDVDFPETQEAAANRAAALQAERQKVESRYREAMRPGGMYIFRDE